MISETAITVSQNAQVSLKSTKPADKETESKKDDKDVEDTIDLNIGFNLAEGLKNAKNEEELLSLLKEGQEQAKEQVEKFKALSESRLGGKDGANRSDPNSVIFDSVRDVVVELMQNQSNPDREQGDVSFQTKLAMAIRERDPDLMNRIEKKLNA